MLAQLRHQISDFWKGQSATQKMLMIGLFVVGIVLTAGFLSWANTPSYEVAFTGLEEADAGQIIEALNEENITYQLRGSGTILVPSNLVHEVRLKMAREGLPKGGTVGFEIFSGSTFGMTEFTQRVNYRRALEGELERTIGSLYAIDAVRVHIVTPEKTLLAGDQPPTTAAVTVNVKSGATADAAQIRSITHLVASSVEGLSPDNVVVVDVRGNLLASGVGSNSSAGLVSQTDERMAAEAAYANAIESRVQNLLDTVLGPNRSVVKAQVAMDWTERETTTQSYDPKDAVIRSSQTVSETYSPSGETVGGIPGAESNLPPDLEEAELEGTEWVIYQRTEETLNYEITEIQSHEAVLPGLVQRVSLSVLVDGVTETTELATLNDAIIAAAGIDHERGDVVSVESLAFDRSYYEEQAAELDGQKNTDLFIKIGTAVLAAVVLGLLLLYVQRLFSNLRLASAEAWTPIMKPALATAIGAQSTPSALPSDINRPERSASQDDASLPIPSKVVPEPDEIEIQRLTKELTDANPANVADIIHLWLNEDEG